MDWDAILMSVNSDPTKPLNEGGVKIVKSVQRGTVSWQNEKSGSVPINAVDTTKSIVIITSGHSGTVNVKLNDSTTLTYFLVNASVEWQVVEFY